MKIAKVVKIENNLISLEFANMSVKKFLRDNFSKEPYVGQKVEILNNGLIVEVQKKENEKKTPDKALQICSIIMLIMYILLLISIIYRKIIFYNSIGITFGILAYIFITLVMFCLSAFFVNNKIINFISKLLFGIIIAIYALRAIIYALAVIWTIIACAACL